jgi:hypothetical protein
MDGSGGPYFLKGEFLQVEDQDSAAEMVEKESPHRNYTASTKAHNHGGHEKRIGEDKGRGTFDQLFFLHQRCCVWVCWRWKEEKRKGKEKGEKTWRNPQCETPANRAKWTG